MEEAQPAKLLRDYIPSRPKGRTVVVGCGKAAAAMAAAFERGWKKPLSGLVVTMYGHRVATKHIEVIEARHPVPDDAGLEAARKILKLAQSLQDNDLLIFLASGGGSALLPLPAEGISLGEKQIINSALLKSGADIFEMNIVRKHMSSIKGGKLAVAAYPAKVITLAISDIPGDDPGVIASGPTVPDPTTLNEALEVLEKYNITVPDNVLNHLQNNIKETPKPDDPRFKNNELLLIATPQKSLEAASRIANKHSFPAFILSNAIGGEARVVAQVHAEIARQVKKYGQPCPKPCVLLSGGETTVKVNGNGRGGRNVEFLLSLAIGLNGESNIWALAADTDGIDGTEDNAGAIITPTTLARSYRENINAKSMLENNDAYSFFSRLNDLIITGPTLTNVNDFRAILIE